MSRADGTVERIALGAILLAALALRVWGITYGLPHPTARPDEEVVIAKVAGFDGGDFNPHWWAYATFYLYVLYGYLKAFLLGMHMLGFAAQGASLAETARRDPALVYLLGRAFSAVLGTVTVWLVFLLGRALASPRAGLLGACLLAVAFLHVRESHFLKPDAALAFLTTAALLACVHLERHPSLAAAAVTGALSGLAFGIKYSVATLVPGGVAALLGGRPGAWRRLLVIGATAVAAVLLTSPYMVLDYRTFRGWMWYARMVIQHSGEGPWAGFRYHAENSFALAQGLPFSLASLGAFLWTARRRDFLPVNVFLLASAFQLAAAALAYTRYVTPLVPAMCVLSGVALAEITAGVGCAPARVAMAFVMLLVLQGRSLHASIRFDELAARPDTRLLARRWLDARVPPGTTILILGSPWPYTFADPVLDGYLVRRNPTLDPELGIAYVITHEHPIPFSHVPDAFSALRPRLRLEATFSPFDGDEVPRGTVFETRDAFYLPLAGFDGVVRGGPLIRVYAVRPDADAGDRLRPPA